MKYHRIAILHVVFATFIALGVFLYQGNYDPWEYTRMYGCFISGYGVCYSWTLPYILRK